MTGSEGSSRRSASLATSASAPPASICGKTLGDAALQRLALWGKEQAAPFARRQGGRRAAVLERGQGLSGGGDHLQGPQDSLAVAGTQARGGGGIEAGEFGVQLRGFASLRLLANAGANVFGHGGNVGQALREGAEIEAGAADENQRARMRREDLAGARLVKADREIDGPVDLAEQQMGRAAAPPPRSAGR